MLLVLPETHALAETKTGLSDIKKIQSFKMQLILIDLLKKTSYNKKVVYVCLCEGVCMHTHINMSMQEYVF